MKALITGGAGFIGSHLCDALIAEGHQVVVIDNVSTGGRANIKHLLNHPSFQLVQESIMNEIVVDRLTSECDIVYHLAAAVGVQLVVGDPILTIETNVLGTMALLRAAHRYGRKVVVASSSEVYGKSTDLPFREDGDRLMGPTTRQRWTYANTKALGEFLALAYHEQRDLPIVIFRPFNVTGPRQSGRYGMVVPRFVHQALAGEPLTVNGDGLASRCFVNVSDVTWALLRLAEHPEAVGKVFNVGSTEEVTVLDLAKRVIELTGSQSPIVMVPYENAYDRGFESIQRRIPDISRVSALIGYRPRFTLDDTLRQIMDYFLATEPELARNRQG